MPVNTNVDGTDAQFTPTPEDYFEHYPRMVGRVTWRQVRDLIAGNVMDPGYVASMDPAVLSASVKLDSWFRNWCDGEGYERLDGEAMMEAYMQLLDRAVRVLYLGERR